jgi:hypothetical protein
MGKNTPEPNKVSTSYLQWVKTLQPYGQVQQKARQAQKSRRAIAKRKDDQPWEKRCQA